MGTSGTVPGTLIEAFGDNGAYYEANRSTIMQVEMRKTQDVVVRTREEAEALKARIESGELTMFKAAADYSIAPGAKQQLGKGADTIGLFINQCLAAIGMYSMRVVLAQPVTRGEKRGRYRVLEEAN